MSFKIQTKKFVEEGSRVNEFAWVYAHIPEIHGVEEVRGKMYSVVNLSGPLGLDCISAINVFLEKLESIYFSSAPLNIPSILERSIKKALFALNGYFESVGIIEGIIFDFGCVVIKEDLLYIAKVEESHIYLIRDNKVLDLGSNLRDISNPKTIETGSGILQDGDKIILANDKADKLIADWALFSRYTEEELNKLIPHSDDEEEKLAILVIEMEEEVREVVKKVEKKKEKMIVEEQQQVPIKENKKNGFFEKTVPKILSIGDLIGEKIFSFVKSIGIKIKDFVIKLFNNREEIKKGVLEKSHFVIEKSSRYIKKENRESLLSNIKNISQFSKTRKFQDIKKNRKIVVPVVIGGLVIFLIGFFFIRNSYVIAQKQNEFNSISTTLGQNLNKIKGTNDVSQIDSIYNSSITLANQAIALNIDNSKINKLKDSISSVEYGIHDIVPVSTNAQILSDLSLTYTNVTPDSIDILDNKLLITSPSSQGAFFVNTDTPSSGSRLSSNLLADPISVASLDQGGAVIFDKNNGALQVDAQGNISQIAGLSDIKNIVSISSFEGNIYFLDANDQVIYKAVPVGSGYSVASTFISDQNLSNAQSIAVDGNVFVVSPTNGVIRYYGGSNTPFKIGNFDKLGKQLGPITYIYDNKYLTNIYLLDPQNSRVVVLQKPTGSDTVTYPFIKQYIYTGSKHLFDNLSAICVDRTEQNMYLLNGTKVLKVTL